MMSAEFLPWIYALLSALFFREQGEWVEITYVKNAMAKGAVCLDGSPSAYHLAPGFGSGVNNWLVHLEGGAWCINDATCLNRSRTHLGSSRKMGRVPFWGILSSKPESNPDFYNWNKVVVRYCDGSSFTGDVDAVDPVTNLHYRGARIWDAVMDDLLEKGMQYAENALLSGCSAGGLATMLHCDRFRSLFHSLPEPVGTNVKCFSDAGFIIDVKDITGTNRINEYLGDVMTTHNSKLPEWCLAEKMPPFMCFFPQYMARGIRTPLFLLNAAYDSVQIRNNFVPDVADPSGSWHDCKQDLKNCSSSQLQTLEGFRSEFLRAVFELGPSLSRGLFINSCYSHCQSVTSDTWFGSNSPALNKIRIAEAVGDWYFGRGPRGVNFHQKIDCPYPCDSTCITRIW